MIGPERPGIVTINSGPNISANFFCSSADALYLDTCFSVDFFTDERCLRSPHHESHDRLKWVMSTLGIARIIKN